MEVWMAAMTKVLRWARIIPTLLGVTDLPLDNKVYPTHGGGNGVGWQWYGRSNGAGDGYGPDPWDKWGDGHHYGGGNGRGVGYVYSYGNEEGDGVHY
jgi:hypothetical protein